ncbi:glycoside hydrolase family 26 protein [Streptomyces sp. NPDC058579]|uniref:glycoside hydrolase family 26 protein n=1 Tax=Streptomyces sp. NPDC058579 TaxID=3346548 RepID=UPI003666878A
MRPMLRRVPASVALSAALALVLTACSTPDRRAAAPPKLGSAGSKAAPELPFDVRPLIHPPKKYFGAAMKGAPHSMKAVDDYTVMVGKRPNLIEYHAAWGDGFDSSGVRKAWESGALTVLSWEPFRTSLADIADGASDGYIAEYARAVRTLNLPVAITFADEMNGFWEEWGTEHATPEEYVRAWRRIHDVFADVGAANVIWTWSPNVINPMKKVALRPYYPGDAYVDWVGLVGYFTRVDPPDEFDELFGPTIAQIRTFSPKPLIVLETAAVPGSRRAADVRQLFKGVSAARDVVGFVWFNHKAPRADWRLAKGSEALAEFRRLAAADIYGFDVRKVR